jgi:hypothetical protein
MFPQGRYLGKWKKWGHRPSSPSFDNRKNFGKKHTGYFFYLIFFISSQKIAQINTDNSVIKEVTDCLFFF